MALRAVASHAVCGVNGFVAEAAGKPAKHKPKGRRHDAIRKILSQAFDRRAGYSRSIESMHIAADDFCDLCTGLGDSFFETVCNGCDMHGKAALRYEA